VIVSCCGQRARIPVPVTGTGRPWISTPETDARLDPARSSGLPAFLAGDPRGDSGLMIAHYTHAAIVSKLKR
jgi:hypothetical protein